MKRSSANVALMDGPVSTGITEQIVDSVSKIDAEAWEQIRQSDDIFMDLRLLQAVEKSMQATSRFWYAIYREGDVPVAIAVLCSFKVDIGVLANDDLSRKIIGCLRKVWKRLVEHRIVFCGLPIATCQTSLRFAADVDSRLILKQLDQTLSQIARRDRAKVIVVKEFTDEELPVLKPLEQMGYQKADSLPNHCVHLTGSTWNDYLMALCNKKRHNIRQSMKKFESKGFHLITTSDYDEVERLFTPATHKLYEAMLARSKTQFEYLPREFFLEMARQLPENCEFQFAMCGDQVIGFGLCTFCQGAYFALYAGLDYEFNRDADLYFNLLYRVIGDAAGHSASVVEVGQNADALKCTKLGAVQSRRAIYVRGSSRIANWIIRKFFNQLFPPRPLISEQATA